MIIPLSHNVTFKITAAKTLAASLVHTWEMGVIFLVICTNNSFTKQGLIEENERQNSKIEYLLHNGRDTSSRKASKEGFSSEQGNF